MNRFWAVWLLIPRRHQPTKLRADSYLEPARFRMEFQDSPSRLSSIRWKANRSEPTALPRAVKALRFAGSTLQSLKPRPIFWASSRRSDSLSRRINWPHKMSRKAPKFLIYEDIKLPVETFIDEHATAAFIIAVKHRQPSLTEEKCPLAAKASQCSQQGGHA